MEQYSFLADLLQTFRMMSDSVKVLLIYMPGILFISTYAIYLHHLRHVLARQSEMRPYTILPPEKTSRERVADTLRSLEKHMPRAEEQRVSRDGGMKAGDEAR